MCSKLFTAYWLHRAPTQNPLSLRNSLGTLIRGGADKPENMQWQTAEAAKAKDKIEQALQRAPARQPVGLRDCSVAGGLLGVAHALGKG